MTQQSAMTGWNSPEFNADMHGVKVAMVVTDERGQHTSDGPVCLPGVNAQQFAHDSVPQQNDGQGGSI